MLASISPLGERARRQPWGLTVIAHLIGSAAGGAVIGSIAGAAGSLAPLPTGGAGLVIAAAATCAAAVALDRSGLRPPGPRRQVDERWLDRYRGWVYGAGFGFQLGLIVVTIVTTWAQWAVVVIAALTASPAAGALVGAGFGLLRAAPLLALRDVHDPDRLRHVHSRYQALHQPLMLAGHLVLGALSLALTAAVAVT